MKIEFIKDKLQRAINQAERSIGKNLSLPILNNIILETRDKKLVIKATNLEIGIEVEVPANIDGTLSIALNPTILNNILQHLPTNDKIEFSFNEDVVTITTNKGVVTLKTQKTEDFPIIPKIVAGQTFTLPASVLADGIKQVAYAAALSDIKPEIASIYMYSQDHMLYFVATDGFRLSEKSFPFTQTLQQPISIIIPLKNALEINRIISEYESNKEVLITTDTNQIALTIDGLYFTSRIIDGVYPDYRQVMPKSLITTTIINKQELVGVLKLVGVLADKFNKLSISVSKDCITFEMKNTDVGEGTLTIPHTDFSGPDVSLIVSGRYLLDVIQSISDDKLTIGFNETNKPLYIKGVSDSSFQGLVMPLRG